MNQSGDTIVEVLIALAIISLMLVGAFMVTHRSTATVQDTQEHMQALSIANAQLEFLRQHPVDGLAASENCFNADGNAASASGTDCSFDSNGRSGCVASTSAYCYKVNITSQPEPLPADKDPKDVPTQTYKYNVEITWQSLLGDGESKTNLVYKLSQANPDYIPALGSDALGNASIGAAPCTGSHCGGGSLGSYSFKTGVLNNTFAVQKELIKECMWDFQDSSDPPVWRDAVSDPAAKCYQGDVKAHDYSHAPEVQGLPAYPQACFPSTGGAPGATGAGNHKYYISLTIRLVDGRIMKTPAGSALIAHVPFCP